MTKEKKKIERLDEEIGALESQYTSRTFSYDSDADKGYQDYLAMMRDGGQKAMEDTVGKASALTGGYANSYATMAGQQVYNDHVKQAAEAQPAFQQLAREEYDAQNQDIINRLNMLKQRKSDIWDDAAFKAGFGDYSGYEDAGIDADIAKEHLGGYEAPTEEQIAYAKEVYKSGGEKMLNAYVAQLAGVNTDAIFEAIDTDEELNGSKEVMKHRFSMRDDGGVNGFGGLDNDAKLALDNGEPKTVKEWLKELTDPDGDYGWTEEEAKEFLLEVQKLTGIYEKG